MEAIFIQKLPPPPPIAVDHSDGVADAGKFVKLDATGKLDTTIIDASVVSHSGLDDLDHDDHTHYSLASGVRDFTGIIRYNLAKVFTTDLDIVDKKYVDDSIPVAINTTTGITDAGKHIKTDSTGYLDPSFIVQTDIDHGSISGLSHDDHTQYSLVSGTRDFTGIVQYDAHKTFTQDTDIVDKKFVEDSLPVAINTTTGIADADKHIKTDSTGYLDTAFIVQSEISHSSIADLDHDDHPHYSKANGTRAFTGIISYSASNSFTNPLEIPDVAYVDSKAVGLKPYYDAVRVASPEDFSTYVYNNGTAGVGAYLEAPDDNVSYNTHDSILLSTVDRVLVYNDTDNASETTNVTCVADVAGSLNNKYFWLYSKTKSYYAWYNVSAGGVDPNPAIPAGGPTTKQGVEIAIVTGDADTVVCSKSQLVLNALPEFNVSDLGSAVLQIAGINFSGEVKNTSAGNSGFAVTLITEGKDVGYRNGVYYVSDVGNGAGTKFKLVRSTDFDVASTTHITQGAYFFVDEGTINGSSSYVESYAGFSTTGGANTFTVGETAITFGLFSRPEQIVAGGGLTKIGSTLAVGAGDGIDVAADSIAVDVTDIIDTNYGLVEDSNNIRVHLDTAGGLGFDAVDKSIEIKPDSTTGVTIAPLAISANGAGVTVDNSSIEHTAGSLHVKADGIKDTMIDFGTGANQVSAVDVPIADAGLYFGTDNVEAALQQLAAVDTSKFKTITTPSGTSPVADSPSGILSLTSTNGVITITGNSTTDTIDFDIATDGIDTTHIDWGTGANQVYANDMPIADTGGYFGTDTVEAALQYLGSVYNKFQTITTPLGTSPVADSPTDTLTFTTTNSTVKVTGTATTDTIDFDIYADGIKETHIDFGTGTGQVSAVDIPILDTGTYTAQTEVEGAIQELYSQGLTHLTSATHKTQDQLVHNIAETSYVELTRTGLQIDSVITWETVAKLKKIREELYTYSGSNVSIIVTNQYGSNGITISETITDTISRDGNGFVTSISSVLS